MRRTQKILGAYSVCCLLAAPAVTFAQTSGPAGSGGVDTAPIEVDRIPSGDPTLPDGMDGIPEDDLATVAVTGVIEQEPGYDSDSEPAARLVLSSGTEGKIRLDTSESGLELENHVGEIFTIEGTVSSDSMGPALHVMSAYPAEPGQMKSPSQIDAESSEPDVPQLEGDGLPAGTPPIE